MGYYGLMMNISMALGPFVGLLAITQWGSSMMFVVSAASVVIGTFTGTFNYLTKRREKGCNRKDSEEKRIKNEGLN